VNLDHFLEQQTGGVRAPAAVLAIQEPDGDLDVVGVNTSEESLFGIGSVTKVMTATLVMQQVQRGRIGLDDPIATYLPEFEVSPPSATASITIEQLLTHTSGIDFADAFIDTGDDADCLKNFVRDVASKSPLLHDPGDFWSYSNGGYSLLGRLIEVLEGKRWEDAIIAGIFDPLGLSATFATRLRRSDQLAVGHRYDSTVGAIVEEPGWLPSSAGPAGSNLVATAEDLVTFANALLGGEGVLLDPTLALKMSEPMAIPHMPQQGIGWKVPAPGVLAHSGTTRGFSAHLERRPSGRVVSVVANGPGAHLMASAVLSQIEGESVAEPEDGPSGEILEPAMYAGIYRRRFAEQRVFLEGSRLMAETMYSGPLADIHGSLPAVELRHSSGSVFTSQRDFEETPSKWVFYRTESLEPASHVLAGNRLHRRQP